MAQPLVTSELAAYEFLRMLASWAGGAILAGGTGKRGDRVQIARKMDFHLKDDKGGWGTTQKINVVESVTLEQDIVAGVDATMDMLADPDTFSDEQIRPLARRFGQAMVSLRGQKTLVMAEPAYDGETVSFVAAGNGMVVGVRKLQHASPDKVHFEFRVVFGFVGAAAKVAGIFSSPGEKQIAALMAEKKRLTELLNKRSVGSGKAKIPGSFEEWQDFLKLSAEETIGMAPKAPWVGFDPDTIKIRKPPRFTFTAPDPPLTPPSSPDPTPSWFNRMMNW